MKSTVIILLVLLALAFLIDVSARKVNQKRNVNSKSKSSKSKDSKSKDSKDSKSKDSKDDDKWAALGKLAEKREKRAEIQKGVLMKLYDSIIWPKNGQLAVAIEAGNYSVVKDLITEDIVGRIHPLGRFDTYISTAEYFFGLAGPLPGASTTGRNRVTTILFTQPIFCRNNSCSYRVVATLKDFATNQSISNYTQIGYMNFNSKNQICSYEFSFLGLSRKDAPENPASRNATINSLCNGIQASCTGANQQFANFSECFNFMKTIPYGGWGQGDQNTQQCRLLHLQLVRASPATHCPHTGPTGGGKCIFHAEETYHGEPFDQCRDKNW
eukprot:TRINITY_DN9176_c0_g1_i1.p1 TRINITY_DN9176_c0_g1~~TRINITY_DN9176_c0_g1_i1.p1  ORF type:complete len:327 (-),score=84.42 TRINITY_DN9176_c0_g1_i1:160-1140(-)